MKKTVLIFLMFITCFCKIAAQEFNESERVQNGDLTLFDNKISDLALAKMNNSELRLLRNMAYAKYGHIFNSEDLTKFYSQFGWYKPVKKVSDSELSEKELKLVNRITVFETRQETKASLKFGKEINGVWHISAVMPATWADRFVIEPENIMEFLVSNFEENPVVKEYLGHYEIRGNVIIFNVDRIVKKDATIKLEETLQFKFPVTAVSEVSFMDGKLTRQMLKIGSYEYYLYYNDPRS